MIHRVLIIFLFIPAFLHAQVHDSSADTSSVSHDAYTTFEYYDQAKNHSLKGDSLNASACFLKVNPYYLMSMGQTPETLDTFYTEFSLTANAKSKYKELFTATFTKPNTSIYNTFKTMYDEDQAIRNKLDHCGDSLSCAVFKKQMRVSDSVHFKYLRNYVEKNGWPSFENGSLWAEIIAVHDHTNHGFYLPVIRKAVSDGLIPKSIYSLIAYYNKGKNTEDFLESANKVVFDISCVLAGGTPDAATLDRINKASKEHCPVKSVHVVFEMNDTVEHNNFYKVANNHTLTEVHKIMDYIEKPCSNGLVATHLKRTKSNKKKLTLYLLY